MHQLLPPVALHRPHPKLDPRLPLPSPTPPTPFGMQLPVHLYASRACRAAVDWLAVFTAASSAATATVARRTASSAAAAPHPLSLLLPLPASLLLPPLPPR